MSVLNFEVLITYTWGQNLVLDMPVNGLAPNSARPSAYTGMTKKLDMIFFPSFFIYRQVSDIRCTEFQNLNVSRLGLQLFLRNILKPGVKPRMKM